LTNWKGKPEDGLNLNMLLARGAGWDEHETGECVGLETNFMKLNSYGIHIQIKQQRTPERRKKTIETFIHSLNAK